MVNANKLSSIGLKNIIGTLERSIRVITQKENAQDTSQDEIETLRAGVIQAYELCWKFMKRWLETNVGREIVDGVTRVELFRRAAGNRLIADVDKWITFHEARNRTSHEYDSIIAEYVYKSALAFLPYAKRFLEDAEKRL